MKVTAVFIFSTTNLNDYYEESVILEPINTSYKCFSEQSDVENWRVFVFFPWKIVDQNTKALKIIV